MNIIGELINASRKSVRPLIEEKNAEGIQQLAQEQVDGGADFIDVNAGVFVNKEVEYLSWLVTTVQETVDIPCCIDSPNPAAIEKALEVHKGTPMINSISLERERYDAMLPFVTQNDRKVVALCMSDDAMPTTKDDRMKIADKLINNLTGKGVALENIFVDPLVQPLSTDKTYGMEFMNTVDEIMRTFPGVHTICGLSNISYGLPKRKFLNQNFVTMAIGKGLDSAVCNPKDARMMANIVAAEALAGRDEYCEAYLNAYRAGLMEL